jgi:oligopeptide/dipeptide ABC transporter ATP-binding protein
VSNGLAPAIDVAQLLEVRDLTVEFERGRGFPPLRAVDGVSLTIAPRETLGLVGESGSGKTTIGRAILGLSPIKHGSISFAGADVTQAGYRQRRALSADLQVVFQDPFSSLNPTRTIGQTLGEMLRVLGRPDRATVIARVTEILRRVGLPPEAAHRYPTHFSGGQRQRIAIARALIVQPRLVVCDEPVSALDLSIQAQVLNLLHELQDEFKLSYLFIAHNLTIVRHLSHRIVVLYRGRIMEQGDAATVYSYPAHPYTQILLQTAPVPDPAEQSRRRANRVTARSDNSANIAENSCPFSARCPYAIGLCRTQRPPLEATSQGSLVACHRWREVADGIGGAAASARANGQQPRHPATGFS